MLRLIAIVVTVTAVAAIVAFSVRRPDADRLRARADSAFRAGDAASAARSLEQLWTSTTPTSLDRLLRARVELALDRPERAVDEVSRVTDEDPIAALARLFQGQVEVKRGRLSAAEAAFRRAVRLQPRFAQAHRELAFVYNIQHRIEELDFELDALARMGELTPAYLLHWTKTKNANWNASKDVVELERFVAGDPGDRWSRLALAEGYRHLGRFGEAAVVLETLGPTDAEAVALRARLALEQGDVPGALALLEGRPLDEPALALIRGDLDLLRGDAEAARRSFGIAAKSEPSSRRAAAGLARALRLLGRESEAEPYEARVARHDALGLLVAQATAAERANDADLRLEIGRACADLGRSAEARAWFEAVVSLDPTHAEAQAALAAIEAAPGATR